MRSDRNEDLVLPFFCLVDLASAKLAAKYYVQTLLFERHANRLREVGCCPEQSYVSDPRWRRNVRVMRRLSEAEAEADLSLLVRLARRENEKGEGRTAKGERRRGWDARYVLALCR